MHKFDNPAHVIGPYKCMHIKEADICWESFATLVVLPDSNLNYMVSNIIFEY